MYWCCFYFSAATVENNAKIPYGFYCSPMKCYSIVHYNIK